MLEQGVIPEGQFIVTSLIQNSDGTKIVLDDEKNVVEIFFDGIPIINEINGLRLSENAAVVDKRSPHGVLVAVRGNRDEERIS